MNVEDAIAKIEAQTAVALARLAIRKAALTEIGAKLARGEKLTYDEARLLQDSRYLASGT